MGDFVRRLNATGIATTLRDTRGSDIDAASAIRGVRRSRVVQRG